MKSILELLMPPKVGQVWKRNRGFPNDYSVIITDVDNNKIFYKLSDYVQCDVYVNNLRVFESDFRLS